MIKEAIKTAPTIEAAKMAALLELGLTEDDNYSIEVLKTPVKKTFGLFGGSPAEVKISIEVPDEKPAPAKKEFKEVKKDAPKSQKPEAKPFVQKESTKAAPETTTTAAPAEKKSSLKETDDYKNTADYIAEIVKSLGISECKVKTFANDEEIEFELDCGDDYGIVIGRRGETLDAIQYLARMVANRGFSGYKRVSINIGNYREKRANALIALAKKDAARALRTGRNVTLEPMNPYERRIIHTAVQEVEGATSFSVGQELDRRVVIAPENGGKPSYNDKNDRGYNNRRDNRRPDSRDRDRRPKREPYVPQVSTERQHKDDAAGVSVYGKIEIKKDNTAE